MKRLEEIKNEYAQTLEFTDWNDLRSFHILEDVPGLEEFENEVTYLYTKECVKASLQKASENYHFIDEDGYYFEYLKPNEVTEESNIVLL